MQGMQALPKAVMHVLRHAEKDLTRQARQARGGFRLAAPMTAAQHPVWKEFRGEKVRDGTAFFVLCLFSYAAGSTNAVRILL